MSSVVAVRFVIQNSELMTVATADASGKPWVSPVGYVADDVYNLYWVSDKNAIHSKNVHERTQVGIVITGANPSGELDDVYFDAEAKELSNPEEIESAIRLRSTIDELEKFKINSVDDVTGDAAWRIYVARPLHVFKRSDGEANGQAITVREEISLADLRS